MAEIFPTLKQRFQGVRCVSCRTDYPAVPFRYTCDACGENLDIVYDYKAIGDRWSRDDLHRNSDPTLWRFAPLFPVTNLPENRSLQIGGTPLVSVPDLAEDLALRQLWIKDDTRLPSGSLKDRATEVALQHAAEQGAETIVAASTGNAAASLACLCAYYHRRAIILAPASAPPAKLTQILQYGAILCPIDGSYDAAFDSAIKLTDRMFWYSRNTGYNPILSEGKKSVALEIAEQLDWQVPEQIFVPVGDGCIIGGVYKAFHDLMELDWIDHLPKLVAVQAEGSAAIVDAVNTDKVLHKVNANTVADSISVDFPRDGRKAIRAVTETGGYGMKVTDGEILSAQMRLANQTGIFVEPAAAAAFAGLIKARENNRLSANDSAVVLATGNGLKDIPSAQRKIRIPEPVNPDFEEIKRFIQSST